MIRPIGKQPRKRVTKRRVISNIEWGEYLRRSPQTFVKYLKKYQDEGHEYNDKDIYSVFRLHEWLIEQRFKEYELEKQGQLDSGTGLAPISEWGKI